MAGIHNDCNVPIVLALAERTSVQQMAVLMIPVVLSDSPERLMEPPEEIDRPKTSGSPVSVGFLEDNSTVQMSWVGQSLPVVP
jgi:hypothetical protein